MVCLYNLSIEDGLKKISTKKRDAKRAPLKKNCFLFIEKAKYRMVVVIKKKRETLSALKKTKAPAKQTQKFLKKLEYLKFSK